MSEFAKIVREKRESKQMTQKELAEKIGVSAACVSMYESGETTPKIAIAAKLASALGVTCEELVNGKE